MTELDNLTRNQAQSLAMIIRCSSALSFIGSLTMMIDIIKSGGMRKQCRLRILSGISIFDMMSSSAFFMGPWPVDKDEIFQEYGLKAYGNYHTCQAQGFFTALLCGSVCYNVCLAITYVLIVKYEKSEDWLKSMVEPWMHFGSISLTLVLAVLMLPFCFDAYKNAFQLGCIPYHSVHRYADIFFYNGVNVMIGLITVLMIVLYQAVRKQEKKIQKFKSRTSLVRRASTSRMVAHQCLAFSISFYIVYIPEVINSYTDTAIKEGDYQYPMLILLVLCTPLQGFLNALVYFRPRIARNIALGIKRLSRGEENTR